MSQNKLMISLQCRSVTSAVCNTYIIRCRRKHTRGSAEHRQTTEWCTTEGFQFFAFKALALFVYFESEKKILVLCVGAGFAVCRGFKSPLAHVENSHFVLFWHHTNAFSSLSVAVLKELCGVFGCRLHASFVRYHIMYTGTKRGMLFLYSVTTSSLKH